LSSTRERNGKAIVFNDQSGSLVLVGEKHWGKDLMHLGRVFFRIVSGFRKVVRQSRKEEEFDSFKGAESVLNPKCTLEFIFEGWYG